MDSHIRRLERDAATGDPSAVQRLRETLERSHPTPPDPMAHLRDGRGMLPSFAWPGGYAIRYLTQDNGELCADCANGANGSEATTLLDNGLGEDTDPQWLIVAHYVHWEGPATYCDHCNCEIESEYGDPDEPEFPTTPEVTEALAQVLAQNPHLTYSGYSPSGAVMLGVGDVECDSCAGYGGAPCECHEGADPSGWCDGSDCPECGGTGRIEKDPLPVRLQVTTDGWQVHYGDPGYDLDHTGYWGAGYLCGETDLAELAQELLDEAREDYATR